MFWWLRRDCAISARPVRAADPCRFMFSDEGGVGTTSSSRTRRARSRRATRATGLAAFGAARRDFGAERAGFAAFFVVLAFARAFVFFPPDRVAGRRPAAVLRAGRAVFPARAALRLALGSRR